MYCRQCGNKNGRTTTFCINCGNVLVSIASQEESATFYRCPYCKKQTATQDPFCEGCGYNFTTRKPATKRQQKYLRPETRRLKSNLMLLFNLCLLVLIVLFVIVYASFGR
ncbi:hypothetical protein CBF34_09105 [Vagococcus penaei]|uniref:Uncharacterized protein n=1 Tax=Vagococcus penaei TaxID=633807 RepID=A0A1Q2D618_9ENTE|nr:zinc ribbon domain-containing protein [Vagococcus penaei]AQP53707.1 hypothetical protein BW732_05275 [Vagococcus penaei]RST99455.1 hypothetical protein CBF34_09105 [Vagococcus penaei]